MKKFIKWIAKIFKAEIYDVKIVCNGNELINSLKNK